MVFVGPRPETLKVTVQQPLRAAAREAGLP